MNDIALVFFGVLAFLVICLLPGVHGSRIANEPVYVRALDRFFLWAVALAIAVTVSAWLGRLPNA